MQETAEIDSYRRMLLDKKAQVLVKLGVRFDTMAAMGRVAEEDQAQLTHEEYVSSSLNSLDYERLRLVQEALDRIKSGDYGVCQACEDPIPDKRLRVVPWARYCVSCQERLADAPLFAATASTRPFPQTV